MSSAAAVDTARALDIDRADVADSLDERGHAVTGKVLPAADCRRLRSRYEEARWPGALAQLLRRCRAAGQQQSRTQSVMPRRYSAFSLRAFSAAS